MGRTDSNGQTSHWFFTVKKVGLHLTLLFTVQAVDALDDKMHTRGYRSLYVLNRECAV